MSSVVTVALPGPQGVQGPAGWTWRGEWDVDTIYAGPTLVGDVVTGAPDVVHFAGAAYVAVADPTVGEAPDVSADWQLVVEKGDPNSLAVGTVTTGAAGSSAAATITGTAPSQTLSLTIPQGATGPANSLSVGTVTTSAPGSDAGISITGTAPSQTLSMTLPRGATGPANSLSVGTVTTGAAGSSAAATITGTAPSQTLSLTIPQGIKGATGPANSLSVGTVTTGAAGSSAAATITGTAPSQTLSLTIPQGIKGDTGDVPGTRTITAGDGLTGGGDLSADRALAVGAGTGVTVSADAVAVDTTWGDARWRTMVRATFADADASCAATTRYLGQVGTMTASRTVTLPAANAVPAGTEIIVADDSGTVTTANAIVVARAGSDTINGATSLTIGQAYGARKLYSDGASKWSLDGGVLRASSNLSDVASAPTALTNLGAVPAATVGNLFTANQANCGESGTTTGFTASAATLAVLTSGADEGSNCIEVTATGANSGFYVPSGMFSAATFKPVYPGAPVTVHARVRADAPTSSLIARVYWYTAAGASIGSGYPFTTGAITTSWGTLSGTVVAPATAAYANVRLYLAAGSAGDKWQVDRLGTWVGAGGEWGPPGVPISDLGQRVSHPATDDVLAQTWDATQGRWQATWYDSGVRDVSSLLVNGWAASAARLRRINTHVELVVSGLDGSSATSGTVLTLPAGYRPPAAIPNPIGDTAATVPNRVITSNTNGTIVVGTGYTSVTSGAIRLEWNTSTARDASLPGTLISAAPNA